MYAGPLRLLRALTVSATWVALSLATHLIGAGSGVHHVSVVAVLGLLMTTVLLTLVLAGLSGRRWTLGRSLVALALGQVGLHAIFTVLLTSPPDHSPVGPVGGLSMVLAHAVAALLIGVGIAVSDSALGHLLLRRSLACRLGLERVVAVAPGRADPGPRCGCRRSGRGERFARWQRPRILTDLVVLQCRSGRGPPALAS